jgi:hypothetical protein
MGVILKYMAVFSAALMVSAGFCWADSQPPAVGGVLPEFTLPVPKADDHQQYLGVIGKDSFKIPEIKADIVIIEIFNIY